MDKEEREYFEDILAEKDEKIKQLKEQIDKQIQITISSKKESELNLNIKQENVKLKRRLENALKKERCLAEENKKLDSGIDDLRVSLSEAQQELLDKKLDIARLNESNKAYVKEGKKVLVKNSRLLEKIRCLEGESDRLYRYIGRVTVDGFFENETE